MKGLHFVAPSLLTDMHSWLSAVSKASYMRPILAWFGVVVEGDVEQTIYAVQ